MIFHEAASLGVRAIKFSGGEPTIRHDVVQIIADAAKIFEDVSMTTNGLLLPDLASELKEAGLDRVNVSLHSLDHSTYAEVTQRDRLQDAIRGLRAAREAGIGKIKANVVIMQGPTFDALGDTLLFAFEEGVDLQVIELETDREGEKQVFFQMMYISLKGFEDALRKCAIRSEQRKMHARWRFLIDRTSLQHQILPIQFSNGSLERIFSNPDLDQRRITIEVVRPWRNKEFCMGCTRLRVTSDGMLKSCLLTDDYNLNIAPIFQKEESERKVALNELIREANLSRNPYWT